MPVFLSSGVPIPAPPAGPFAILFRVTVNGPDELRPVILSDDDLGWDDDETEDDTARLLEERPPHWSV